MKKYFLIGIVIFALFLVLPTMAKSEDAGPKGIHEPGTGIDNPELKEQNKGTGLGLTVTSVSGTEINDTDEEDVKEVTSSEENVGGQNPTALERRSRVANAVQEMLNVADREDGGIGAKVREIAQEQKTMNENMEGKLEKIKNQNRFFRFLFGAKLKDIDELKTQIQSSTSKIEDLKTSVKEMTNEEVKTRLEAQIKTLEEVKSQIQSETNQETSNFSLFGWVKKLFK